MVGEDDETTVKKINQVCSSERGFTTDVPIFWLYSQSAEVVNAFRWKCHLFQLSLANRTALLLTVG